MSHRHSSIRRRRLLILAFVALSFYGCAPQDSGPPGETGSSAPKEATAATAPLRVVDRAEYDALLAELQGKIVLVDFWATWCAPCVEQLPHTFDLAAQRRDAGLAVVTVCMEDPDDIRRIQQFLESRGGTETVNLLSSLGGGSPAMEAFEITGGALPHYKLYDRESQLHRTFALDPSAAEQFTSSDIESAVDALLEE